MTQLEVLNEELENLTREADLLLGELEAPLKSARPLGIDVEKIKSDVTRRVEESQDLTEMKRTLEERAMQVYDVEITPPYSSPV
ncbi:hypothetical protein COOONC_21665 [Cooperia oncophora]